MYGIVLDTNVLVAALRSRRGASYALLGSIGRSWQPLISVALVLEYEAVAKRETERSHLPMEAADEIIDRFCLLGRKVETQIQVRPSLPDPKDEFLLELAVNGSADAIVTHNVRHLSEGRRFGIPVLTPGEFLRKIRAEGL